MPWAVDEVAPRLSRISEHPEAVQVPMSRLSSSLGGVTTPAYELFSILSDILCVFRIGFLSMEDDMPKCWSVLIAAFVSPPACRGP